MLGGSVDVKIFSISAKLALEAKLAAKPHHPSVGPAADAWGRSRFGPLQEYLDSILTDEEKVRVDVFDVFGGGEAKGGRVCITPRPRHAPITHNANNKPPNPNNKQQ